MHCNETEILETLGGLGALTPAEKKARDRERKVKARERARAKAAKARAKKAAGKAKAKAKAKPAIAASGGPNLLPIALGAAALLFLN